MQSSTVGEGGKSEGFWNTPRLLLCSVICRQGFGLYLEVANSLRRTVKLKKNIIVSYAWCVCVCVRVHMCMHHGM